MSLTQSEQAFVRRMVPHIQAGMTFEEAAKAVLADDERLYLALHDEKTGTAIKSEMAGIVYRRLRA